MQHTVATKEQAGAGRLKKVEVDVRIPPCLKAGFCYLELRAAYPSAAIPCVVQWRVAASVLGETCLQKRSPHTPIERTIIKDCTDVKGVHPLVQFVALTFFSLSPCGDREGNSSVYHERKSVYSTK